MRVLRSSLFAALAALAPLAAAQAFAAEPPRTAPVDNVLDRLERRLLDQEQDSLSFGERAAAKDPPKDRPAPAARYRFKKSTIEGRTSELDALKALGVTLTDLENQVDQLASTIQKTKQTVIDDAKVDNFVEIEAAMPDTDAAALRTLTIKLDGYPVYDLQDGGGLWLPSKAVPLYAGPLQPGPHRLDLAARLVMRHPGALPLSGDLYHFVNKTFDLQIPSGTVNARYVIAISPPGKPDEPADATMKEAL